MLFESSSDIQSRQQAARRWIEAYNKKTSGAGPEGKIDRALATIILTLRTSDYLAEYDPMALAQAQRALSDESWENYS